MQRIDLVKSQLTSSNRDNSNEKQNNMKALCNNPMEDFLNDTEISYLLKLRNYLETNIDINHIYELTEKSEFPFKVFEDLVFNFPEILSMTIDTSKFKGISETLARALMIEVSKFDLSLFTFILVHGRLCTGIIDKAGSKDQKERYIDDMSKMKQIGSFCLTEIEIGSEANNIKTTYEETEQGFVINGNKRWIGNANIANIIIVFAKEKTNKNSTSKKPNFGAFIIEPNKLDIINKNKLTITKIEDKLAFRMVQNCELKFDNLLIDKSFKLPKVNSFGEISEFLIRSRLNICFALVGVTLGVLNKILHYSSNTKYNDSLLSSNQLIQSKIVKIASNLEALFSLIKRVADYCDLNGLSQGKIGMVKSWGSHLARESIMLSAEILGNDRILYHNYVMKCLLDIEPVITYEGTYEINVLTTGKEITGIPAYY